MSDVLHARVDIGIKKKMTRNDSSCFLRPYVSRINIIERLKKYIRKWGNEKQKITCTWGHVNRQRHSTYTCMPSKANPVKKDDLMNNLQKVIDVAQYWQQMKIYITNIRVTRLWRINGFYWYLFIDSSFVVYVIKLCWIIKHIIPMYHMF